MQRGGSISIVDKKICSMDTHFSSWIRKIAQGTVIGGCGAKKPVVKG